MRPEGVVTQGQKQKGNERCERCHRDANDEWHTSARKTLRKTLAARLQPAASRAVPGLRLEPTERVALCHAKCRFSGVVDRFPGQFCRLSDRLYDRLA